MMQQSCLVRPEGLTWYRSSVVPPATVGLLTASLQGGRHGEPARSVGQHERLLQVAHAGHVNVHATQRLPLPRPLFQP